MPRALTARCRPTWRCSSAARSRDRNLRMLVGTAYALPGFSCLAHSSGVPRQRRLEKSAGAPGPRPRWGYKHEPGGAGKEFSIDELWRKQAIPEEAVRMRAELTWVAVARQAN